MADSPDAKPAPAKPKRYTLTRDYTFRFHTQLLRLRMGADLEPAVGEFLLAHDGPVRVEG